MTLVYIHSENGLSKAAKEVVEKRADDYRGITFKNKNESFLRIDSTDRDGIFNFINYESNVS